MESLAVRQAFWGGKRVLLTGHTGFKGTWATQMLAQAGAEVHGLALAPDGTPSLFDMLEGRGLASSTIGDIMDREIVIEKVREVQPHIVVHLAAQPLVRCSYRTPVETLAVNVMGTAHLLDALWRFGDAKAVLVVTSDKVYENRESDQAFTESDRLGGHDPYSASKAAAEIAAAAFRRSYFAKAGVPLATARGGNVIGGGDFSADRLIPDMVRADMRASPLKLRNPQATRPWQHVLDCLAGYFAYLQALAEGQELPPALNFGPSAAGGCLTVAEVRSMFSEHLETPLEWEPDTADAPHETGRLAIDSGAAERLLGWRSRYSAREAIGLTGAWYRAWREGADPADLTLSQVSSFLLP